MTHYESERFRISTSVSRKNLSLDKKAVSCYTFQHDGAPSHKTEDTRDLISATCQSTNKEWSPNSPGGKAMETTQLYQTLVDRCFKTEFGKGLERSIHGDNS